MVHTDRHEDLEGDADMLRAPGWSNSSEYEVLPPSEACPSWRAFSVISLVLLVPLVVGAPTSSIEQKRFLPADTAGVPAGAALAAVPRPFSCLAKSREFSHTYAAFRSIARELPKHRTHAMHGLRSAEVEHRLHLSSLLSSFSHRGRFIDHNPVRKYRKDGAVDKSTACLSPVPSSSPTQSKAV